MREDIAEQLGLRDHASLVGDFDRPNLTYRALPRGRLLDQVLGVIQRHAGEAGIVYALRRRDTEDLARDLASAGIRAQPYHAGLPADERARVQEDFLAERLEVVVATVAFGMGIDRSDVRFVVHASLPKGIEQYSQATGRAGRARLPYQSECVGCARTGVKSRAGRARQQPWGVAVGDGTATRPMPAMPALTCPARARP